MNLLAKNISSKRNVAGDLSDDEIPKLIAWKMKKSPSTYESSRLTSQTSFQKNWAALSSTLRERTLRRRAAITESDTDWGLLTSGNESDDGKAANFREEEETMEVIVRIDPEKIYGNDIKEQCMLSKYKTEGIDINTGTYMNNFFYDGEISTVSTQLGVSSRSNTLNEPSITGAAGENLENNYLHAIKRVSFDNTSLLDINSEGIQYNDDILLLNHNIASKCEKVPEKPAANENTSLIDKDYSGGQRDSGFHSISDTMSFGMEYALRTKNRVQCHSDGVYRQFVTSDEVIDTDFYDDFYYQKESVNKKASGSSDNDNFSRAIDSYFDDIDSENETDHTYEAIGTKRDFDENDLIELCRLAVEILSCSDMKSHKEYTLLSGSLRGKDCHWDNCHRINEGLSQFSGASVESSQATSKTSNASDTESEIYSSSVRNIVSISEGDKSIASSSRSDSSSNLSSSVLELDTNWSLQKEGHSYNSLPNFDNKDLHNLNSDQSIVLPSVSSFQSLTFTEILGTSRGSADLLKLEETSSNCSSTDDGLYNIPNNMPCDISQKSMKRKRRVVFNDQISLFEIETEHKSGNGFKKKEMKKVELPVIEDMRWSDLSDETKTESECETQSCDSSCSCNSSLVEFQTTSVLMRIINSITRCQWIGGNVYDRLNVRDSIQSRKTRRKRLNSYDSGISRSSSESSLDKIGIDWNGSADSNIDIDRTLTILEEKAKLCEEKLFKQLAKSFSEKAVNNQTVTVETQRETKYQKPYSRTVKPEEWIECSEEDLYDTIMEPRMEKEASNWRGGESPTAESPQDSSSSPVSPDDGKHSLLQFALQHFRQNPSDRVGSGDELDKKKKSKKHKEPGADWTWKEQVDMVKFSKVPIAASLLCLDTTELNKLAIECFLAIMKYMGDLPMGKQQSEVDCVYTLLMNCHKHSPLRDEVYCQLMKQTTSNRSARQDSCQRGWRLLCIVAAYFDCSHTLQPYLLKYLESAAYDKRRAYHGTALVCLQNLRKTIRYGGRKNVPSIEEITALTAGRNAKRQIYQLPGGTERIINTKSTTVVQDIIEEICLELNIHSQEEMEEFSLYCIVEGDTFTMPLAREEYILDVTTELHKNEQIFYLIFCRSVWHHSLRLDSPLYVEVAFNQIAPDYLEGLLLVMPGEALSQDTVYDISKIAALLHRAPGLEHMPNMKETKFLLPKPALAVRDIKPPQWVSLVQSSWKEVDSVKPTQAKAQVLEILQKWPLFGSSFFAVKRVAEPGERAEHILALNKRGVHFLDVITHETLIHYPFSEVISTRKVKSEDGALFLDMKCGNLMQQRITRIQTDQAHEISRLIRQYINIEQRQQTEKPKK
ncbi:hypothetical protein QYM36_012239 [Artemia franciscana]|uniref:Unconventional myosin-XV n=1 Tax=Artemia franciscana TaxID=6661 RepID=A0AA88HSE0_ARTSF|nr:hypothetical protein QYM36_012239 [Artemia franciscana]